MSENEESPSYSTQESGFSEANNKGSSPFKRFFGEVWQFTKIVLVSLAIVLPVRFFVAQPFIVNGASMEPTFQDGEYLIVDELSYLLRSPERGDVTVFRYPQNPSQFFIKRIIGLPGETVIIKDGTVSIQSAAYPNGVTLEEQYLPPLLETMPNKYAVLGADEYFVMGDNRDQSYDSRQWGVLGEKFIVGRTLLRLWPITEVGVVTSL